MKQYEVYFAGKLQESFDYRDQADEWALEVAETGRVVDVAVKYHLLPPVLINVFPEEARKSRAGTWGLPPETMPFVGGP